MLQHAVLTDRGTSTVADILATVYDDVPEEKHWIATSSLWAHLRKLVHDGQVTGVDVDDIETSWSPQ